MGRAPRMLVAGGANLDGVASANRLRPGESSPGVVRLGVGGAARNVAENLARPAAVRLGGRAAVRVGGSPYGAGAGPHGREPDPDGAL
ncbi:MAG: hypothetical protein RMM30_10890 [Armatimonadota bacterium]|nr:hypothetical protein [Armatimonadota bacterium]MDW8157075.1 hypothetical protein [Armatimonadota bacterium]